MYPASPPLPAPEEPLARRADGLLGALFSLALAYGAGGWLVLLHYAEGGHEHHEPNLLVHWLRDGSLALPGTLLAVWLALRVADRYLGSARRSSGIWAASLAAIAGVAGSAVLAFGTPVHEWLFHADEGHELPLALHVGRDFILALAAAFPLCGAVAASMLRVQRSARLPLASGVGARTQLLRVAVAGATLLRRRPTRLAFVGIALLAFTGASVRIGESATGPGTPCPSTAPVKKFDVTAIDIDIPLNKFGDHDPKGKMYVLNGKLAAAKNEATTRQVSTGLRDDPIQPLVIRANEGDCVEINFTNSASGGDFGVHIDGLAYDVGSSGDNVGRNGSSAAAGGTSRLYRDYIPNSPAVEGAHYLHPGPGMRFAVNHGLYGVLVAEPPGSTYLDVKTAQPTTSGWEAMIVPAANKSFREFVKIYGEIGNEGEQVFDKTGQPLPQKDSLTGSYRP